MARALIVVLDSLGIGGAPDAAAFNDLGANTLGHIAEGCATGQGDRPGLRSGPLHLPHLVRLGLGEAAAAVTASIPPGLEGLGAPIGAYGHAIEVSRGKDTPSGHWEMAGVPVDFDWYYFPHLEPCFPPWLTDALIERCRLPGVLGNRHASGTIILDELGQEHLATGKPILYTSADSVLQIAAHEKSFGLERLLEVCHSARELLDEHKLRVGRVIARPFLGEKAGDFRRTGNRRDLSLPPPAPTLLERLVDSGGTVLAVGKVADIFVHRGISEILKADNNEALFDATLAALARAPDRGLIFTNFVNFDMLYGHRRDLAGYAAALEAFDARLTELEAALGPEDIAIITADHGNDPSRAGSDHTREQVPILLFGPRVAPVYLGRRDTFADIGQSVAEHLGIGALEFGQSFL
ncbi:MAG: phosphopentomutase [Candidatus Competibacteraceae bacterium]|nr:phosphopentomutase [Candidatus Competibacteraceae bacterium]